MNPAELIAWASLLTDPTVPAWRAQDSGCRFVHVGANHHRAPIRGHVTAVLSCDQHPEFWDALHLEDLHNGGTRPLSLRALAKAWEAMPNRRHHRTPPQPNPDPTEP